MSNNPELEKDIIGRLTTHDLDAAFSHIGTPQEKERLEALYASNLPFFQRLRDGFKETAVDNDQVEVQLRVTAIVVSAMQRRLEIEALERTFSATQIVTKTQPKSAT